MNTERWGDSEWKAEMARRRHLPLGPTVQEQLQDTYEVPFRIPDLLNETDQTETILTLDAGDEIIECHIQIVEREVGMTSFVSGSPDRGRAQLELGDIATLDAADLAAGELLGSNGASWVAVTPASLPTGSQHGFGGSYVPGYVTELVEIADAATTSSTIEIPAGARLKGVSTRVTVQPPGTSTFDLGISGDTTRFGSGNNSAANETSVVYLGPTAYPTATVVVFTPDVTPSDATGRIRLVVEYELMTAPTS